MSRRRLLEMLGAGTILAAIPTSVRGLAGETVCELSPEQMIGPYHIQPELERQDIRESLPGVPLTIRLRILDYRCEPLGGARVEVWHCNAKGFYSGYLEVDPNRPIPFELRSQDPRLLGVSLRDGERFLRGWQHTDSEGWVQFQSIVPGWYYRRAPHVHLRVYPGAPVGEPIGDTVACHTGQVFFPESFMDEVAALDIYRERPLKRILLREDPVYTRQNAVQSVFQIAWAVGASRLDGVVGSISLAVIPDKISSPPRLRLPFFQIP
jgi:protocatechuate 3,4-dioxygenase beta subunit